MLLVSILFSLKYGPGPISTNIFVLSILSRENNSDKFFTSNTLFLFNKISSNAISIPRISYTKVRITEFCENSSTTKNE